MITRLSTFHLFELGHHLLSVGFGVVLVRAWLRPILRLKPPLQTPKTKILARLYISQAKTRNPMLPNPQAQTPKSQANPQPSDADAKDKAHDPLTLNPRPLNPKLQAR